MVVCISKWHKSISSGETWKTASAAGLRFIQILHQLGFDWNILKYTEIKGTLQRTNLSHHWKGKVTAGRGYVSFFFIAHLDFTVKYILKYCWLKKSCTTWHVWNPVNNGIFTISTGAGLLPSTVTCNIVVLHHWWGTVTVPTKCIH